MLAASVTVQSLGAQAWDGQHGCKEETVESPVAMDVVYGYQNTAKSGRFLPLKIELSSSPARCLMEPVYSGHGVGLPGI